MDLSLSFQIALGVFGGLCAFALVRALGLPLVTESVGGTAIVYDRRKVFISGLVGCWLIAALLTTIGATSVTPWIYIVAVAISGLLAFVGLYASAAFVSGFFGYTWGRFAFFIFFAATSLYLALVAIRGFRFQYEGIWYPWGFQ